jgi:hypothetical protein
MSEDGSVENSTDEKSENDRKDDVQDDPPEIVLCMELLSITDGQDFFAHF